MKRILANSACLIIAVFFTLGMTEIYFRIFRPQPIRPATFRFDPVYGIRMKPNLKGYISEGEYRHTFQLNSLGFRDIEPTHTKEPDTYRIIGLGDSMTWGVGVGQHKPYLKQLEAMLNKKDSGVRYEVYNWGTTAWGTAQELACFRQQAIGYKPDLVILQYYKANDLDDNVYTSIFKLDEKGNLLYSDYGRVKMAAIKRITERIPFYYFISQHSHLVSFIRLRLLAKVENADEEIIDESYGGDHLDYGLRLTEAILREFFSLAGANNIKIVMLVVPDRFELAGEEGALSAGQKRKYVRETAMIRDLCQEYAVNMIDFSDVFNRDEIYSIYYKKDCHFTAYGNKIAAQAIKKILVEEVFSSNEKGNI